MHPQAIIFDFDGVIADTEPLHHRAFDEALSSLGINLTHAEYAANYLGLADREVFESALRDAGQATDKALLDQLHQAKNAAYMRLIAADLSPLPGLSELLPQLSARWPLAICSGARRVEIQTLLSRFALGAHFEACVTVEDTSASKPDPAGYRLAVQRLASRHPGIATRGCLAIEDSRHGIAAAQAAGLRVVAVCSTYVADELVGADAVVGDLRQITPELIIDLLARPAKG